MIKITQEDIEVKDYAYNLGCAKEVKATDYAGVLADECLDKHLSVLSVRSVATSQQFREFAKKKSRQSRDLDR